MKIRSKIVSLVLAVAMMATLLPAGIGVVSAVGDASKFLAAIEPITDYTGWVAISDRAGLEAMAGNLSGKYYLTNDIDLSGAEWTPIGTSALPFTGTFDGQGYVIKNLKIKGNSQYAGLFGSASGATIKNVGLEGTYIDISYLYVYAGGICAYTSRDVSTTISNCYNTGTISASSDSNSASGAGAYVGGICGYGYVNISNCYNTGDVSASGSSVGVDLCLGGICGNSPDSTTSNASKATISNCYNTGDVSASGLRWHHLGGICGYIGNVNISNCYNTGTVSASAGSTTSAYAGGICGYSSSSTISNCYNTGDVSVSDSAYACAGGICGHNRSSTTISNCYNTGDVSASAGSSEANAGGICGGTYNYTITISNCYNTGDVSASSTGNAGRAGGICGFSAIGIGSTRITISNCYNTGDVSTSSGRGAYAGGICGDSTSTSTISNRITITNCYWNSDSAQMVNGSPQTPKKGVGDGTDTTTSLTTAQMKQQASFVGFDFATVWEMVSGKDYPQLRPYTPPPPTTYTVTVNAGTGASGGGSYAAGATVTINAGTAPAGKQFKNWTTTTSGVSFAAANSVSTTFTMPTNAVTVTAVFEDIPSTTVYYTVTIVSESTDASGNDSYEQGTLVSIDAGTPPAGKQFKNWTTTTSGLSFIFADSSSNAFIMPAADVTVTAVFEPITDTFNNLVVNGQPAYNKKLAMEGITNATAAYWEFYDIQDWIDRGYYDFAFMVDGKLQQLYSKPSDFIAGSDTNVVFALKDIYVDGVRKTLVNISIAGTQQVSDWVRDFIFASNKSGGQHLGFAQNQQAISDNEANIYFSRAGVTLKQIIDKTYAGSDEYLIFVNGHSLGAAVANLYVHDLYNRGTNQFPYKGLVGYTFATPMPYEKGYSSNPEAYPIFNIINDDDLVTHVGAGAVDNGMRMGVDVIFKSTLEFRNKVYGSQYAENIEPKMLYGILGEIIVTGVMPNIVNGIAVGLTVAGLVGYEWPRHEQPTYKMITESLIYPANSSEKGHVLGNPTIGIGDAQLAFRAALKLVTLTGDQLYAADLDGNGMVEISEAMRIFRYALKLSTEL